MPGKILPGMLILALGVLPAAVNNVNENYD